MIAFQNVMLHMFVSQLASWKPKNIWYKTQ